MGLGQTLLTIMALVLMGRLIITMNTATLDTGFTKDIAEYRITGTSLGTSMLEKAGALAFDENTILSNVNAATSLSSTLGPESEANETAFDDVDDYNGFVKIDTLPSSAIFRTAVTVQYATISGSAVVPTTTRTFTKILTVNITSAFLIDYSINPPKQDTLRFQSLFSYWYFR